MNHLNIKINNNFKLSIVLFLVLFTIEIIAAYLLDLKYHDNKWDFTTFFVVINLYLYNNNIINNSWIAVALTGVIDYTIVLFSVFSTYLFNIKSQVILSLIIFLIIKVLLFSSPFFK